MSQEILDTYKAQKSYFSSHKTLSIKSRIDTLKKLKSLIFSNMDQINESLHKDLAKCEFESVTHEISGVIEELNFAIKRVKKFSKGKRVKNGIAVFPSSSKVMPRPKGNVLIFSPWNYPFLLTLRPIISALAAGNVVMFKPSEITPSVSKLMVDLFNSNFDEGIIRGFEGGVETSNQLLTLNFDHIFFTGSTSVGQIIYEKAAKHLTPVTLELGGKSPCVIDKNVNLSVAAKKIAWAKSMNAGQTCVAPDYVLIPRDSKEKFIKEFSKWITHFYGEDPSTNNEYTAIVSDRHFLRIKNLLEGEKILFGGKENGRKISPTIVETSNFNSKVMKEEIFGPILPVIAYEDESEIESHISNSPNPLALYVFTNSKSWANRILDTTPSGGAVINDLVIHLAHPNLPFGGVRQSGIGNYHGFFGLETFSHMRAELRKPKSKWFDNPVKYPPFNKIKLKIIKIIFGL